MRSEKTDEIGTYVAKGKISIEKKEPLVLHKECDSIFKVRRLDSKYSNIQFRKMNMDHLLNKPYVNEVTLTEQK